MKLVVLERYDLESVLEHRMLLVLGCTRSKSYCNQRQLYIIGIARRCTDCGFWIDALDPDPD